MNSLFAQQKSRSKYRGEPSLLRSFTTGVAIGLMTVMTVPHLAFAGDLSQSGSTGETLPPNDSLQPGSEPATLAEDLATHLQTLYAVENVEDPAYLYIPIVLQMASHAHQAIFGEPPELHRLGLMIESVVDINDAIVDAPPPADHDLFFANGNTLIGFNQDGSPFEAMIRPADLEWMSDLHDDVLTLVPGVHIDYVCADMLGPNGQIERSILQVRTTRDQTGQVVSMMAMTIGHDLAQTDENLMAGSLASWRIRWQQIMCVGSFALMVSALMLCVGTSIGCFAGTGGLGAIVCVTALCSCCALVVAATQAIQSCNGISINDLSPVVAAVLDGLGLLCLGACLFIPIINS